MPNWVEMTICRPHTVTFDCWSTVLYEVDLQDARERRIVSVQEVASRVGRDVSAEEAGAVLDRTWDRFDANWRRRVAPTTADLASWILDFLDIEDEILSEILKETLSVQALDRQVIPLDGVGRVLEALSAVGVKMALICDTGYSPGAVTRTILDRYGLLDHFGVTTFSDEVGVTKPHPMMFTTTLDLLGSAPDGAVHIGDLRRTDIAGARSVGMGTVRITAHNDDTSDHPEADAVVESYECLLEILGYA